MLASELLARRAHRHLGLQPETPVFALVKSVAFDRHPLRFGSTDDDVIDA
jgi:hypothetical protein